MALLKVAEKQVFNISGSSKTKKTFSLTIAVLFAFNSISWTAPAQQNTLRAISTGQKDRAGKTKPLHKQTLSTLDAALNATLPEKPSVPLDSLALQSQLAEEIQQALAEPAISIEISKTLHKSHYDRVLSILSKLRPGQGLREGDVTYRLTKDDRVIIHLKTSGADYVRVYSLNNKGLLIKTDRYGKPVMALPVLTGVEEAVRDFLRSRVRFDQKSSSAGELVQVEDLTFKVSSEELERMKNANPTFAEDLEKLIKTFPATGPLKERIARANMKTILPSLLRISIVPEAYLVLAARYIDDPKAVPLLIREEGYAKAESGKYGPTYKSYIIQDISAADILRIRRKLSGLTGFNAKFEERLAGLRLVNKENLDEYIKPWDNLRSWIEDSHRQSRFIKPIAITSLVSKSDKQRFKIGDTLVEPDIKKPGIPQTYPLIDISQLDYYLKLKDVFSPEAVEELISLHRWIRAHWDTLQRDMRKLNTKLTKKIVRGKPEFRYIAPSIICAMFKYVNEKRKAQAAAMQKKADKGTPNLRGGYDAPASSYIDIYDIGRYGLVLAISKENRFVPVLLGIEGVVLPDSMTEKTGNIIEGPILLAPFSEEAIRILSTLPKESIEHAVWKAYAQQQGVEVSSKSSSAGMRINEFAELKPVALYATGFSAVLIEQLSTLHEQIMRKNNALAEVIRDKYTIGPIKGLKSPISLIGPFSYTDGIQVALMAIEYSDQPPRLLAISNDPRLSLYKAMIKNMPVLEAIIYQFIDSGSLPPEAIPAWKDYLKAHQKEIPEVRIETEQNPLPVFEGSRAYLAMMKEIQPELYKQLLELTSYIRTEPTAGVKKFRGYIGEKLEKLDGATFKDMGLVTGVTPRDFLFSIKAKDTDQTFIISRWSAISPPSQIGRIPQSLRIPDIDRIVVVKSIPKSSSAGFADCVELKDLDLKNQYFELTKELQSLQVGIRESFQEFLPFELSELIQQEDMAMAIDKKNLQRILLAIGPFRHGEKKLFLLLVKGKTFHRIIAIDPQDLKYLWIDITDKGGFVRIIENFIEELKRKREDDTLAAEQLATLRRWIAVWNSAVEIQTIKPFSAAAILGRSSKGLKEISQSA